MRLDVFCRDGSALRLAGSCALPTAVEAPSIEVLHSTDDDDTLHGSLRPPEAHRFDFTWISDGRGRRLALVAEDDACPTVLPGWRAEE